MANETKKLSMIFGADGGNDVTISVDNPVQNLDVETVNTVMEDITQLSIFVDKNNLPITSCKGAKITTTTVQELF